MNKSKKKYVSTQLVSRKSGSAFQEGARIAMKTNGYVIIAEDGWVVKKFSNGNTEKLEQLESNESEKLILD